MNRIIYHISGPDSEGTEQDIFQAGLDTSDNPVVLIGDQEVVLNNVMEEPSGGQAGQLLTKTTDGITWSDAPNPVEANPTVVGTETKLNSIKIANTNYIVGGTGGFPEEATAGDAMVYNGSAWAKQGNYGYSTIDDSHTIEWNGQSEGKASFAYNGINYYRVADLPYTSIEQYYGATLYAYIYSTDVTADTTIADTANRYLVSYIDGVYLGGIVLDAAATETVPAGIYFAILGDLYTNKMSYGTPSVVKQFDQKYIYPSGIAGNGLIYSNGAWTTVTDYAYITPASTFTVQWDGETTGHESIMDMYFKMDSSIIPSGLKEGDSFLGTGTVVTEEGTEVLDCTFSVKDTDMYPEGLYPIVNSDQNFALFVATQDVEIMGITFTTGIWFEGEFDGENKSYVSSIEFTSTRQVHTFNTEYIPISFNQTDHEVLLKGINFNDINYTITSIDETNRPNRIIGSTSTKGDLIWNTPFELQSTTTITGTGSQTVFYLLHNFGIPNVICECKDSSGTIFTDYTGTNVSNDIYKIEFTTAPAASTTYTVTIKPGMVTETLRIVNGPDDTYPVTEEEATNLGFTFENIGE